MAIKLTIADNESQEIKHIIEKLIRFIIMRNPNVIKFKDGTMVDISTTKAIQNVNEGGPNEKNLEQIYRGYMTSVQITENGFFMRINDVNKIISGKSALRKILELRNESNFSSSKELHDKISLSEKYQHYCKEKLPDYLLKLSDTNPLAQKVLRRTGLLNLFVRLRFNQSYVNRLANYFYCDTHREAIEMGLTVVYDNPVCLSE